MSKTLVIVTHPNIEQSHVNKSWVDALKAHPDLYTVHEIYKLYPDGKIDGICQDTSKKLVRSLFIPEEPQQGLCPYASLPQDIFLT